MADGAGMVRRTSGSPRRARMYWRALCGRRGICVSRRTPRPGSSASAGHEAWPRAFARSDDRKHNWCSNREGSGCFAHDNFRPQCIVFAAVKEKVIESLVFENITRPYRERAPTPEAKRKLQIAPELLI